MPLPSAAEMNPSDGGLAVFGRVTLGVMVALVVGGALSMAVLLIPSPVVEIVAAAGTGAAVGFMMSIVVAPPTGFVAGLARRWVRQSRRRALLAGLVVWLVWVVIAALMLAVGLRFPLNLWGNIWPFLPALAVTLLAALWLADRVHHSEEPLTPEELRAEQRRQRAEQKASRPGRQSK
ncbi:hypothetical protein ACPCG0_01275 [Propionibacteriaceae bacterium Y1923]